LEHLLLLKLAAYQDRRGSTKGRKDERDLIRIVYLLDRNGLVEKTLYAYLMQEDVDSLLSLRRSPEFMAVCNKNAHMAKQLREQFSETATLIAAALPQ